MKVVIFLCILALNTENSLEIVLLCTHKWDTFNTIHEEYSCTQLKPMVFKPKSNNYYN
jgi:hypothetical protein